MPKRLHVAFDAQFFYRIEPTGTKNPRVCGFLKVFMSKNRKSIVRMRLAFPNKTKEEIKVFC